MLYFEDFSTGSRQRYGSVTVSAEEIIAFAKEYDPQPMHVDEEAAKGSLLGGLVASGWHSCCLMMRLICDGFLLNSASLGGPGVEETKFLKPVRPGDTLTLDVAVGDKRVSKSRPSMGLISLHYELINQREEPVLALDTVLMIRRRAGEVA